MHHCVFRGAAIRYTGIFPGFVSVHVKTQKLIAYLNMQGRELHEENPGRHALDITRRRLADLGLFAAATED
jgi:hypothetical protein